MLYKNHFNAIITTSSLAQVAKLVDAGDSKSPAERCVGSSPTLGTTFKKTAQMSCFFLRLFKSKPLSLQIYPQKGEIVVSMFMQSSSIFRLVISKHQGVCICRSAACVFKVSNAISIIRGAIWDKSKPWSSHVCIKPLMQIRMDNVAISKSKSAGNLPSWIHNRKERRSCSSHIS